jgi:WD40 repeat protein
LAKAAQTPARRRAILLVRDAATAFQRGDMNRTLDLTGAATAADPAYPRAYIYRGVALQRLGNREAARAAYNRVLALAPASQDASYARTKLKELGLPRSLMTRRPSAPPGTVRVPVGSTNEAEYPVQNLSRKLQQDAGVLALAFVPRSALLASGGSDGSVQLWDANSGALRWKHHGHADRVNSVAVSPDGSTVATGSRDEVVQLRDVRTGASRGVLRGGTGAVTSIAFSPDGRTLAAGSMSGVLLWNSGNGQLVRRVKMGLPVTAIAFSPDNSLLASAGYDRIVRLWNARSGQLLRSFPRVQLAITSLGFSPDSRTLAMGSVGNASLWDVRSANRLHLLRHPGAVVSEVAFSPDGRTLASSSSDKFARLWDVDSGQLRWKLRGHAADVSSVTWNPGAGTLATSSADKTIAVWSVR